MNFIVVTQVVDRSHPTLGFFHEWLLRLSAQARLSVIANQVGSHSLPPSLVLHSLGKEEGVSRIGRALRYRRLLRDFLPASEGVFFHMCPEYVLGAAGIFPRSGKKSLLWYTHRSVSWRLRAALRLVDNVFSASPESFRIPSAKVEYTGHGIDIRKFKPGPSSSGAGGTLRVLTVGRISPVKHLEVLFDVAHALRRRGVERFSIDIVGGPALPSDKVYSRALKERIAREGLEASVRLLGAVPYESIQEVYRAGGIFVNMSGTGSIDKAVLEAMASGLSVITSNEAFRGIVRDDGFVRLDGEEIARRIVEYAKAPPPSLRDYVVRHHSLDRLIEKIIVFFAGGGSGEARYPTS